MTSSPRIYIHTLGCPKNDADSAALARRLRSAGMQPVHIPEEATHILINTCGFITEAKEESIAAILEASEAFPSALLLVMGCLVERYREELPRGIPEVSAWFGVGQEEEIMAALRSAGRDASPDRSRAAGSAPVLAGPPVAPSAVPGLPDGPGGVSFRSYAYIKISDGCDHLCSFCAIPLIKGSYVPLGVDAILEQAQAALESGAKELVLVGQDTAIWESQGLDLNGLVDLLAEDPRVRWIRLLYLQPEHVTDRLLALVAGHPRVCRYLDLPFQHASQPVLERMGRRGSGAEFLQLLDRARRMMPDVSLRSTFIVGFPGETEEDFQALLDFVREAEFDYAGCFVYSPEEGTPAFAFRPRVRRDVAEAREGRLSAILTSRTETANRGLVGTRQQVLIDTVGTTEDAEEMAAVARSARQAPEIDGVTFLEGDLPPGVSAGSLVSVAVTGAFGFDLLARWDGA